MFYWEPFGPWHVSHLTRTTHLKAVADKVLATTFADGSGHPARQRTLLSDEHCSGLAQGTWQRTPNFPDPNPMEHQWDLSEQVLSMEAPLWIKLVSDPGQGHKTCLAPGCWWWIFSVLWVASWGPHGLDLFLHVSQMLNWIGMWGIWRPGQHLELFVTLG